MAMNIKVKRRQTKTKGVAFDLYVRWKGQRYRPTIGYDLSDEEAQRLAIKEVLRIQSGEPARSATPERSPLFKDLLPMYWDSLKIKKRVDERRPRGVFTHHLIPRFGERRIATLTSDDGRQYIIDRTNERAAAPTILREWQILMRVLNLAVKYERLERNPFAHVELPTCEMRTRVAEPHELIAIRDVALPEVWRVVVVALLTLLRESRVLAIESSWIQKRQDGHWLTLPSPRSTLKGNPTHIPLAKAARRALMAPDVQSIAGPIFDRWSRSEAFQRAWRKACSRAHVVDLRVHDLRHTGATWLQRCGVGYEVRQTLLGHRMTGMTAKYSHGGPEWDAQLRDAVTKLEGLFVEYGLGVGMTKKDLAKSG